jgi:hypothetical protein
MLKKLTTLMWILVLFGAVVGQVGAAEQPEIDSALTWLMTNQQDDGGFTNAFAEGSDLGTTVEVVLAAVAADEDPRTWSPSPLAYLTTQVEAGAVESAADLSRVILAVEALGQDARDFGGADLIRQLLDQQSTDTGQFGDSLFAHAYAILALRNAGAAVPEDAVERLRSTQNEDGGWAMLGESEPTAADTNTTALAVQAFVALGEDEVARAALPYLEAMQNDDGGFPWQKPSDFGTETDANSTAVVWQALIALGEPASDWAPEGGSPEDALLALWDAESGGIQWKAEVPGPNVLATAQAMQAIAGMDLVALPGLTGEVPAADAALLPASGALVGYPLALLAGGGLLLAAGLALRKRSAA